MSFLPNITHRYFKATHQYGQALVFTLVFTAAAGLVGLLLFNSGMLANTKTQLQNAADAAAYSAGVLQARDHNFSAYTNRAMVANQVAVAQIVSLKSYLEDAADTHDRMEGWWLKLQAKIPASTPLWDAMLSYPIKSIDSTFKPVAELAVPALDKLIKGFEFAQQSHHLATLASMVLVANEVITRNDPSAKISTGIFSAGNILAKVGKWDASTHRHSANDASAEADRFADIVVSEKSTDGFTRNRTSVLTAAWASEVNSILCPRLFYVGSFSGFIFTHGGGTILSEDKKRWLALDATMGEGGWGCAYEFGPWAWGYGAPTPDSIGNTAPALGGSGGAVAGKGGGYGESFGYKNNPTSTNLYGFAMVNPLTALPANVRRFSKGPGATLDEDGGLQDYYRDMTDPIKSIPKNQSPEESGGAFPITIEAERPATSIRTATKFLPGSSIIKLDDKLASNTMRAMSSAHAYFYRPKSDDAKSFTHGKWKRGDGKTELANQFSPYWQARLVDSSSVELIGSRADQMK